MALGLALTYPIVGTNQVKFYQNDGILTTTPSSSSDAFYGQDAQYFHLTPSYKDNGDGTVTDLNTQLIWQSKRGNKMTIYEAQGNVSIFNLAGYTDWRFASIKELYSLIEFTGKSGETDARCTMYSLYQYELFRDYFWGCYWGKSHRRSRFLIDFVCVNCNARPKR